MTVALVVEDGMPGQLVDLPADGLADRLRAIIGGWLEAVDGPGWHAYVDEEGKVKGRAINAAGTLLAAALGWQGARTDVLCGPVVFLGADGPDESDVPAPVVDAARTAGILPPDSAGQRQDQDQAAPAGRARPAAAWETPELLAAARAYAALDQDQADPGEEHQAAAQLPAPVEVEDRQDQAGPIGDRESGCCFRCRGKPRDYMCTGMYCSCAIH